MYVIFPENGVCIGYIKKMCSIGTLCIGHKSWVKLNEIILFLALLRYLAYACIKILQTCTCMIQVSKNKFYKPRTIIIKNKKITQLTLLITTNLALGVVSHRSRVHFPCLGCQLALAILSNPKCLSHWSIIDQ